MKTICTGAAALLLMGFAVPALAQAPTAPAKSAATTPAAASGETDATKMQCRKQQLPGVLPRYKKVCKTKAEWAVEDKQVEAEMC